MCSEIVHYKSAAKTCDICGKTIQKHFKRHMMSHTGERPYKCKYCDQTFRQLYVLELFHTYELSKNSQAHFFYFIAKGRQKSALEKTRWRKYLSMWTLLTIVPAENWSAKALVRTTLWTSINGQQKQNRRCINPLLNTLINRSKNFVHYKKLLYINWL